MISNGEDIVRVSRLMAQANASFTFNVYYHMLPRRRDPIGDRLRPWCLETKWNRDAENEPAFCWHTQSESVTFPV